MRLGGLGVHHAPYQVPVPDHQEQVHYNGWQVDVPVPVRENNAQVPSRQEQTPVHHARLADQLVHVHKQRKHVHAPVPDVQMLSKEYLPLFLSSTASQPISNYFLLLDKPLSTKELF